MQPPKLTSPASSTLRLEDIVKRSTDLPTIPAAALAVIRETGTNENSARSVAAHIVRDQALSARVLKLANSAYYGLSRQVVDVQEAVVLLGMRAVRNLAVVASTYPWMNRPLSGYMLEPKAMWRHSFGVATGAQLVAQKTKIADPDIAFTAGLLHDIGKVAMSVWLDKKMGAMLNFAQRDNLTFDEAERKLLGYDHCEVGQYLGEVWNLPECIVRPIRYHHSPDECLPSDPLVDCVHIGDYLSSSLGYGLGGDGLRYTVSELAFDRVRFKKEEVDQLSDAFVQAFAAYEEMLEAMGEE
jgi:putative nucleotidyltransferase with HDIG domain